MDNQPIITSSGEQVKKSIWLWVAALLVAVLAAAALYIWSVGGLGALRSGPAGELPYAESPSSAKQESDQTTSDLKVQGSADDVSSIEKDLNDTNLDDLDKELKDINTEAGL